MKKIALNNARQYAALKKANEALREAQEQRIATERWTVLGRAAGNLAHRINNSTALVPVAAQHPSIQSSTLLAWLNLSLKFSRCLNGFILGIPTTCSLKAFRLAEFNSGVGARLQIGSFAIRAECEVYEFGGVG